jgi:pimeloyl-ACP methyl ester carboxylesterase
MTSSRTSARASRLAVLAVASALALGSMSATFGASLRVGTVTLHRCAQRPRAWCGWRAEALDPSLEESPTIRIGFMWYPAASTDAPAGTIVAEEGGPGWPATGSISEYGALFKPLMATHNLLLVDSRGTGRSASIDCPQLQRYLGTTDGRAFQRKVGACGRMLNHTWRAPDGSWMHGSDLFDTAYAVHDLADIVNALDVAPIDLYGDSYGTWFVQSFLTRHADLLRSATLDSAYPMYGGTPWYLSSIRTAKTALRTVCERDRACRREGPGDPWQRLGEMVRRVRVHPLAGATTDPDGRRVHEVVRPRTLVNIAANAGFDPIGYRELDAAVRAGLAGDETPLLRLAALAQFYDDATPVQPRWYSDGLYFAVSCSEYDQLFRMGDAPRARRRQLAAAVGRAPRTRFRPFTPGEWARMNAYSEAYTACLDWPKPEHGLRLPAAGHGPPLAPRGLPVLLVSGELDSWTSPTFGPKIAKEMGPSARFVELANSVHTAALDDTTSTASTACARSIVRGFVRQPSKLGRKDASCASKIPPIHTPGSFPSAFARSPAARVVRGSATEDERRAAVVGAEALGDAMTSWYVDSNSRGAGLRGGRFIGTGWPCVHLRLRHARWVRDATIDGRATWGVTSGRVRGDVRVRGPGGVVRLKLAWSENEPAATARLRGGGALLRFPAP